jgi:hypothetical protein
MLMAKPHLAELHPEGAPRGARSTAETEAAVPHVVILGGGFAGTATTVERSASASSSMLRCLKS